MLQHLADENIYHCLATFTNKEKSSKLSSVPPATSSANSSELAKTWLQI